jgi:hypothetical protein
VTEPIRYAIEIRGPLPTSLESELTGFEVREHDGRTVLNGEVTDSAALYGLLARFESLGICLVSVRPVSTKES